MGTGACARHYAYLNEGLPVKSVFGKISIPKPVISKHLMAKITNQ